MNSTISALFAIAVHFIAKGCARLSSLSESPLFSSILTLHILLILYFPPFLLKLVFSPVTLLTFSLLAALLVLGSPCEDDRDRKPNPEPETEQATTRADPAFFVVDDSFVEWDVKAPLEIIYEEEEDEDEDELLCRLEKTSSLDVYYPETDSETSSEEGEVDGEMDWPEDREGLIEIELGGKVYEELHVEEDNMIEIDLSVGDDD